MDEQQRRKDQQIWAARFMSEKLTKLGKQKAKELDDAPRPAEKRKAYTDAGSEDFQSQVREGVITRIQQRPDLRQSFADLKLPVELRKVSACFAGSEL